MLNHPTSNIRSLILLIFAALCCCATARAQTTCSLKLNQLKDAPELFGFRLGMTFDEVKARSPLIKLGPADEIGVVKTSINPHYDPQVDRTVFPDVRTISFDFLDGKLVTLWIGYESTFKWPVLDDFVAAFSKALDVPGHWPAKRTGQELTCDGFSLFASIIARGPSIRIADEVAQLTVAERREKAAEQAELEVIGNSRTLQYYPSDCAGKDEVPAASRTIFKNKPKRKCRLQTG